MLVGAHHLLLDSWAVGLLLEEVIARYDAGERGVLLQLGPAPADPPPRRPWPAGQCDRPTGRLRFDAGGPMTGRAVQIAARLGITPFAFLLGAFGLALSRHARPDPLLIAVPYAARPTVELQQLVAATANLVLVPVELDRRTTGEYLCGVHRSIRQSLEGGGPATGRCPPVIADREPATALGTAGRAETAPALGPLRQRTPRHAQHSARALDKTLNHCQGASQIRLGNE